MNKTTHTAKTYTLTRHAATCADRLGFTKDELVDTFVNPKAVYPVKARPGQWRMVSREVCMVGVFKGDRFLVLTIFRNGSVAPGHKDYRAVA